MCPHTAAYVHYGLTWAVQPLCYTQSMEELTRKSASEALVRQFRTQFWQKQYDEMETTWLEMVEADVPSEQLLELVDLTDALKGLSSPRDKITDMLRQGIIIRIKKGLYVFGDKYRRHPYSRELLANLVYGPSYVSLDYALAYHGISPERAEALTSVTSSRSRKFSTPVGLFIYRQIPARAYEAGMIRMEGDHDQAFLIAAPEKALADKIVSVRGGPIASVAEMRRFLEEDLRIDAGALGSLSAERIDEFAGRYRSSKLRRLSGLLRWLQRPKEGIPHE